MTTALTILTYLGVGMVAYYLLFFALAAYSNRPGRLLPQQARRKRFVIVVPAHNEALVIDQTIARLRAIEHDGFLALVMNDGSTDGTSELARLAGGQDPRILVIDRGRDVAGQGKGEVLNDAVRIVTGMAAAGDVRLGGAPASEVIVGVVDADGWLDPHALREVEPYFAELDVAGVQLPVRMWNATENFLTLMQDIEFLGFSRLVQAGRDPLGSVGLGGNGQFVRLTALHELGASPWSRCLTEDLDLSVSLIARGWRIRFCPRATVAQQALPRLRPLFRQRTRWIQGHYSCWQHIGPVLGARRSSIVRRLDAAFYLSAVIFVMIFACLLMASIGNYTGLWLVTPRAFSFIHNATLYQGITVAATLAPILAVAITYQRISHTHIPVIALPGVFMLFTFYGYAWAVPSTLRAWWRLLTRQSHWVKTPRVPVTPELMVGAETPAEGQRLLMPGPL